MEIKIIEVDNTDGTTTDHVLIDRGNGEFTSMTKTHYEELEAAKENADKL